MTCRFKLGAVLLWVVLLLPLASARAQPATVRAGAPATVRTLAFCDGQASPQLLEFLNQLVADAKVASVPAGAEPPSLIPPAANGVAACHGSIDCLTGRLSDPQTAAVELELLCSTVNPVVHLWMFVPRAPPGEQLRHRETECPTLNTPGLFSPEHRERLLSFLATWQEQNRGLIAAVPLVGAMGPSPPPEVAGSALATPGGAGDFELSLRLQRDSAPLRRPYGPLFQAGAALVVVGGLMIIPGAVLMAREKSLGGNCMLNGINLNGQECGFTSWPAPPILFAAAGAAVATGSGLLIYWGATARPTAAPNCRGQHAQ